MLLFELFVERKSRCFSFGRQRNTDLHDHACSLVELYAFDHVDTIAHNDAVEVVRFDRKRGVFIKLKSNSITWREPVFFLMVM